MLGNGNQIQEVLHRCESANSPYWESLRFLAVGFVSLASRAASPGRSVNVDLDPNDLPPDPPAENELFAMNAGNLKRVASSGLRTLANARPRPARRPPYRPTPPAKLPSVRWNDYNIRQVDKDTMQMAGHFLKANEIVVLFFDGTTVSAVNAVLSSVGAVSVRKLHGPTPTTPNYVVRIPKPDIRVTVDTLNSFVAVRHAEPNWQGSGGATPNDTRYSQQWNLTKINAPTAWDLTKGSQNTVIAVLDTGVASNEPDLPSSKLVVPSGANILSPSNPPIDGFGHGTAVAAIAAAATDNNYGLAGLAWFPKVMPVKVLNDQGLGFNSDVISGIYFAINNGAHVINMSLHNFFLSEQVRQAVNEAIRRNVAVVGITGNDNSMPYPGSYPNVIATSGTTINDVRMTAATCGVQSNANPANSVSAPGCGIPIPGVNPTGHGTSFAAPHVSGLSALILSRAPSAQSAGVLGTKHLVEDNAIDLGSPGYDQEYGWGRIDAAATLSTTQFTTKTYQANKVQLVTIPVFPESPDACTVFSQFQGRVAWWDIASANYKVCIQGHTLPAVAPGISYWIKGDFPVTRSLSGLSTGKKANHEFRRHLGLNGWHMFGNPFAVNIPWDDSIKIINEATGDEVTLSQAAANNWIQSVSVSGIKRSVIWSYIAPPEGFGYGVTVTGLNNAALVAQWGYLIFTRIPDLTIKFPGRP